MPNIDHRHHNQWPSTLTSSMSGPLTLQTISSELKNNVISTNLTLLHIVNKFIWNHHICSIPFHIDLLNFSITCSDENCNLENNTGNWDSSRKNLERSNFIKSSPILDGFSWRSQCYNLKNIRNQYDTHVTKHDSSNNKNCPMRCVYNKNIMPLCFAKCKFSIGQFFVTQCHWVHLYSDARLFITWFKLNENGLILFLCLSRKRQMQMDKLHRTNSYADFMAKIGALFYILFAAFVTVLSYYSYS
jgi:hypothetical protein